MGQNYDQLKQARVQSKTQAISEVLARKGSGTEVRGRTKIAARLDEASISKPAKRRGRPPKSASTPAPARASTGPRKRRGRPPKVEATVVSAPETAIPTKKRRGRPPKAVGTKAKASAQPASAKTPASELQAVASTKRKPKRLKINDKEVAILAFLNGSGRGRMESYKIADIAAKCFPTEDPEKANAWVRASLRRPVSESWVEKAARGEYRLNLDGRRVLKKATA